MRLNKIKLAGFKSFVDPTTIHLPSNLVGVVGPNGCGKSNVIDAVRWVMGESSAKTLRGDSMADVIFNGSSSRKPVGQAAIELIFDNSQGTLGGHYGQYSEISIKRSVSRDGQSSYFLNGTRCRRRDITDIFLGTGLGPRSYSIIEQGMISRLIEAKPEDLRVFLEEAAGISKYKERRRETETRMRHTRENLDRLNDLREELEKQLNHLQRQARTAERFEVLKQEQRLLKAQLQALRWNTLEQEVVSKEALIKDEEIVGEERTSKLRNIEAQTEKYHEQQVEANDAFNEVQGRFYSVGADIARVEQAIQHAKERLQQLQQDLEQTDSAWNEVQIHIEADSRRIEQLQGELQANEPQLRQAHEAEQASSAVYAEAEQQMQDWQARWDDFNQQAATPSQTAQVERTRIQHLEQHMLQTKQRMERLHSELGHVSSAELEQEIVTLSTQQGEVEQAVNRLQESQQTRQQAIQRQREQNHELSTQLDHSRSQLQTLRGKQASLEALQQAALGKRQGAVSEWLEHQGLRDAKRLAQTLQVDAEWERAVECVLGFNLEAVCVDAIDPVAAMLENLQHGALTLFDTQAGSGTAPVTAGVPLAAKVNSPLHLTALLGGVVTAENLHEALAIRPRLADHESVITRDGIWMGNSWLRVTRDADEKAGVLHREQELKELAAEIERLQLRADELQQQLEQGRQTLRSEEEQRDALQAELNQTNRRFSELRGQLSGRQARLEQLRLRGERIQEELNELTQQYAQNEEAYTASRQQLTEALEQMEVLGQQREALVAERERLREALNQRREQAQVDRNQVHHITLTLQSQRTTLEATQQSLTRMQNQLTQLSGRREELHTALAEGDQPIVVLDQELKTLLASRMAVEKELGDARWRVEEIDHAMRQLSTERHSVEQAIQEVRSRLERLRMDWQGIQVRRQTVVEQISEAGFEAKQLLQELPEQATETTWQEALEAVTKRIERLGPINLAAIDEFKKQSERKEYLDAQNADLTEALDTLETAIRKIDRETRTRFKETYDKVNSSFQTYFPRLFGGGHAYLELTGDDLLSTGVTVMARPPGKRNSTIHLLSGGEKALTAVAMVFSIFELNPAPFCMLDEVDAPLDEANVGRFCELVREMSQRVQFIFITHNKATMELAEQLNGVTMYEPGVSRLVAVDMDEAYQMAAAS